MTSIEVGVRVRPFNSREIKFNCELVIDMPNSTTCEVKGNASKKFFFDHCLWTFKGDDDNIVTDAKRGGDNVFADQKHVYQCIGRRILDNALQGFNACLFAYGQTGSGKTYTMMGVPSDPGIIPRLTRDLFERERDVLGKDDAFALSVEVTYLEIYNESVKDLLNAKNMDKALRVRQHPTFGVYVEGLSKWTVRSEAEVLKLLEDGSSVRSVAATKMNATSSRSHAILTLHIKKKTLQTELASSLHLVDLAGSERAGSTGAEGDTLIEGANINKSLTTLGMCLSRLAEASSGAKSGHVPYRDSQLTWLLNDSLGGNSKTAMLANISPASINAEETLSTLRFASTVKKIKNNAVVNEDPQQRLIRELRAEIEEIKKKIAELETGMPPEVSDGEQPRQEAAVVSSDYDASITHVAEVLGDDVSADSSLVVCREHAADSLADTVELPPRRMVAADSVVVMRPGETTSEHVTDSSDPHDDTHERLLERLEEDTTLMLQVVESQEEKEVRTQAQTEENAAALKDMKELQMNVRLNCPRLVTLNEDLHVLPTVALLYYLHEGDTWAGGHDSDADRGKVDCDETPALMDLPRAACRASEFFFPKHCCVHVDGLRQQVSVVVPSLLEYSGAAKPARVFVNGEPVEPGTSRRLGHLDRIVIGQLAYRGSLPVRWVGDSASFEACAKTPNHCAAVESYERLVVVNHYWRELEVLAAQVSSCVSASQRDELHAAAVAATSLCASEEAALEALYPLTQDSLMQAAAAADTATSAASLQHDYAFAMQEVRRHADAVRSLRAQGHVEAMAELQRQSEEREAQIAALREELQQQEAARNTAARVRLEAREVDARDAIDEELYVALKALVETWREDRAATKRKVEARLKLEHEIRHMQRHESEYRDKVCACEAEERSRVGTDFQVRKAEAERAAEAQLAEATTPERPESQPEVSESSTVSETVAPPTASNTTPLSSPLVHPAASPAPPPQTATDARSRRLSLRGTAPSKHVDVMLQLAADVRKYEEECREAQMWKPNGPSNDVDRAEYEFSITNPTWSEVHTFVNPLPNTLLEGVLHAQDVFKLKRGFLGRQTYHAVSVLVRARYLYYFPINDTSARTLGAAYLHGAGVEESDNGQIEGRKYTLRVVPSVPRKPTKSSKGTTEENNVTFGFDSRDERDVLATLIRRLAAPECPLNVRQYYSQQQQLQ